MATIPMLKEHLQSFDVAFEQLQQDRINQGRPPITEWPSDLQAEKARFEARIIVANEEYQWLQERFKIASESVEKEQNPGMPPNRKNWNGSRVLVQGILKQIDGQLVDLSNDGILIIEDQRSPYDQMPVWRYEIDVVGAMHEEYRRRKRKEDKAAEKENRPRKPVGFPAAPIFNRKTDSIEYVNYSTKTLRKI